MKDKLKLIYDYIYYRCTKCNKALDKDGTYIEVHKQGRTFPFCKDCGEAALNCMKWYGEFVHPRDIKSDDSIFADPAMKTIRIYDEDKNE